MGTVHHQLLGTPQGGTWGATGMWLCLGEASEGCRCCHTAASPRSWEQRSASLLCRRAKDLSALVGGRLPFVYTYLNWLKRGVGTSIAGKPA